MTKDQQALTLAEGKVGLVLSGGGAKGAYHVGVVQCLADHGVRLTAIAGTSVGALNGAVITAAADLGSAANCLEEIWRERVADHNLKVVLREVVPDLYEKYLAPYEEFIEAGLPLYVGVFRSRSRLIDTAWGAVGLAGLSDTPEAEFIRIQTLSRREYKQAILASAAYPLTEKSRSIAGKWYSDGGLGGMVNKQGHTPITPLLRDAGCRAVIVTHNADGSLWDRHNFPEAIVLEIRPGSPIRRRGPLADTSDFSTKSIATWIKQGYQDTERCLATAAHALIAREESHAAQARLDAAIQRLIDTEVREKE